MVRPRRFSAIGLIFVLNLVFCSVQAPRVFAAWLLAGPDFVVTIRAVEGSYPADLAEKLRKDLLEARARVTSFEVKEKPEVQIRREQDILEKLLRSYGYYQGTTRLQPPVEKKWVFEVEPGPLYRIGQVSIDWPENVEHDPSYDPVLPTGSPLLAQGIIDARQRLEKHAEERNCLLNVRSDYRVILDHDRQEADVYLRLQPSPQVVIGEIRIKGLESIEEPVLTKRLKIRSGDCFRREPLNASKTAILRTNLIARLDTREALRADGKTLDITFDLTERSHRTLKAGIGYSTDEKFTFTTGWEHRNLFHGAERFNIDLTLGTYITGLKSQLTVPDYGTTDQVLTLGAEVKQERREGYDSDILKLSAILSRPVTDRWLVSGGSEFKFSEEEENGDTQAYGLLSFPLTATYSSVRNLLDPRRGVIITNQFIPYIDMLDTGTRFFKIISSASTYLTEETWIASPTFAMRAATGVITGGLTNLAVDQLPPDERYYSGGGGSVRGYAYQSLSALDAESDPIGGRSFLEGSSELRLRHGGSWGTVWFLDGGYAYDSTTPGSVNSLLWGAGVGVRYYTSFAPIRFDIAWPLNRRPGVDDIYQIYLNIGQAF